MEKKEGLRRNPWAKRVESRVADNPSQGARLDLNQRTDNIGLTGFQNCYDQ